MISGYHLSRKTAWLICQPNSYFFILRVGKRRRVEIIVPYNEKMYRETSVWCSEMFQECLARCYCVSALCWARGCIFMHPCVFPCVHMSVIFQKIKICECWIWILLGLHLLKVFIGWLTDRENNWKWQVKIFEKLQKLHLTSKNI